MKNTHTKRVRGYVCGNCKMIFSHKWTLKAHYANKHDGEPIQKNINTIIRNNPRPKKSKSKTIREPLICDICKTIVHGKDVLERHKIRRHNDQVNSGNLCK